MEKDKNILIVSAPLGKPQDHPWAEIVKSVAIHAMAGRLCYQKFTCGKCGQRLTMEEPNVLYPEGTCDQCGYTTDIKKAGCNYLLEMRNVTNEEAARVLRGRS